MKAALLFIICLGLFGSCVQSAYPRNYIISHILEEDKDVVVEEELK